MPAVSVIVPIYNVSDYLEKCLESIKGQTLSDIEVICVNDGSTDSSLKIIEKYVAKDDRFRLIDKENAGYGAAMNDGLDAATGEYIGIVEPDDHINGDMFERLYSLATSSGERRDMVKSAWVQFSELDPKGHVVNPYEGLGSDGPVDLDEEIAPLLPHPSIWAGIYRREFLEENGIRFVEAPGAAWADNPFFQETLYLAEKPVFTQEAFYNYLVPSNPRKVELKDTTIAFKRLLEMLDFLDAHDFRRNFYKALYWRSFTYLRASLNSHSFPDNAEETLDVIRGFYSRMPKGLIDDEIFNNEDRYNFELLTSPLSEMPEADSPKVSVIIPCHNVANFMNRCVDSLKAQSLKDFEAIFIDDGSSDYTRAKLYLRTLGDARMRVIVKDDITQGAAKNLGLENACGEYIAFLDCRDTYAPNLLEKVYLRAKETDADIAIVGASRSGAKTRKAKGASLPDLAIFPKKDAFAPLDIDRENIFGAASAIVWDRLISACLIESCDLRFQDLSTYCDTRFAISSLLSAKRICVLDDGLITREKGRSASLAGEGDAWHDVYEALCAVKNRLDELGIYGRLEDEFKGYAVCELRDCCKRMLKSPSLAKLYDAIKGEWLSEFDIQPNGDYPIDQSDREWLEHICENSTIDIILGELQRQIDLKNEAKRDLRAVKKELRDAKAEMRGSKDGTQASSKNHEKQQKAAGPGPVGRIRRLLR